MGGEGVGGSIFWKTPDTALYTVFCTRRKIEIAHRHMNVEIGTVAAQFLF